MIFRPELAKLVRRGLKTQARQPVKTRGGVEQDCPYRPGHHYAIQDGYGLPQQGRITVQTVHQEALGDITDRDARLEGFPTAVAFKAHWLRTHDTQFLERINQGIVDAGGEPLADQDLQAHFRNRHAHKPVWVISFELANDIPRLLSADSSKGYTDKPYLALSEEPEAVSERAQEKYAREGWQGFANRERQRALDRRLLALEDRMRLAWGDAQRLHIDVSGSLQAIDRIVSSMERRTTRDP